MEELSNALLGETTTTFPLSSSADNRQAAWHMAAQAKRSLYILSHNLEHLVYNTQGFSTALGRLAARSRYTEIRVLVQDSRNAVQRAHRLVSLAQRLSSNIHIHKPHWDHRTVSQAFMVADETAYLHRIIASRYEGKANFNDPVKARELLKLFEEMWERSAPDPELRRLDL